MKEGELEVLAFEYRAAYDAAQWVVNSSIE
jgi:hypothetical protein